MRAAAVRVVLGKTDNVPTQVVRYAAGGVAAFAVDVAVLVALTELVGWHYLASAVAGFACGMVAHYAASIRWVFHRRSVRRPPVEFAAFATLGFIGLGVNAAALFLLTEYGGLHYAASKVLAAVPSFTWNFSSRKLLLFSAPDPV